MVVFLVMTGRGAELIGRSRVRPAESGLRIWNTKDITFAVLAVGEHAAWSPTNAIDEAVTDA
jgi:hypothetical protein